MSRCVSAALAAGVVVAGAQALPPNFVDRELDIPFNQAVGVRFASDGRMFVWEKAGRVWTVENGVRSEQPLIDISEEVGDWRDHGMLGFAIDPDFYANGYIYLMYVVDYHHARYFGTPQYNPNANEYFRDTIGRVTRYTANASDGFHSVDPSSRLVLLGETLTNGIPICHQSHSVGTLLFGRDGTLLVSCGDGASYETVDVGGPQSGSSNTCLPDGIITPAQDVGAYRSQLINCYSGKVLRLDPASGAGLPSNPFYDPKDPYSARSRVWAMGLRNPFRTTLRPGTGDPDPALGKPGSIYIGDVGWNAWEELDVAQGGGFNFGWPAFEGMTQMVDYINASPYNLDAPNPLAGGSCAPFIRFRNLIVQETLNTPSWPNPCNPGQQIPAALRHMHHRPMIDWFHSGTGPSRVGTFNGAGIATIANIGAPGSPVPGPQFGGYTSVGGTWTPSTGTLWPAEWRNTYFFADFTLGWLRAATFNDQDRPTLVRDFSNQAGAVVCIQYDPVSDRIWYVNYDEAGTSRVRSIRYTDNAPPIAMASASPRFGPAPLTTTFSSAGTVDPDQGKTPPSIRWDFGDGSYSFLANPVHTYPEEDITAQGQWTAAIFSLNPAHPLGGGNWDPNVMRDGDMPPVGSGDSSRQYDTFHNGQQGNLDWVGLVFPTRRTFTRIIFQEGIHFFDGGWFDTLGVEVLDSGGYVPVNNLVVTPAYAGNDGVNYNTYEMTFDATPGRRIRIVGNPGGSANFISIAELRVFARPAVVPTVPTRYDATLTVTDEFNASDTETVPVWVNNTPPTVEITSPVDGARYPLSDELDIDLRATIGDSEQPGGLTCAWQTILHHNDHEHPEPIDPNCETTTRLSPHGCDGADYHFEIKLTVTDPLGLSTTQSVSVYSADCNGNGIPDNCDIDAGTSLDTDHDGIPDECEPAPKCIADFDHNGIVNSTDVSEFINAWFEDQVNHTLVTDFDGNGVVNSTDVSDFINAYFESPPECLG